MDRRVVITGIGAVTPIGIGIDAFWKNLVEGVNGIRPITRFNTSRVMTTLGGEIQGFDPLVHQEQKDAIHTDRYIQLALAAADEAVEMSGVTGTVDPERGAVYFGTGVGGFETIELNCRRSFEKGPRRISPYFIPMLITNMAAGKIAIRFGFTGEALPAVSACASGATAVGSGYRAIRDGYADVSITGGSEAPITEIGVGAFNTMRVLSTSNDPNAASLPFDRRRNGFVISEGSACIVLEEMERALARGAKIYGEVVGYGSTCDAYHITTPRPDGKEAGRSIALALQQANWKPGENVYVNAHGTGTYFNDLAETNALKVAFGEEEAHKLSISSTKASTGHMLGAAGAFEVIVSLLALRDNVAPPTINLLEADPECDLDYTANVKRERNFDLAISNSFGFGGHNASVAVRRFEK